MVAMKGDSGATTNTRCAAAIYAMDVPIDAGKTLTSAAGHGIKGTCIVWHFAESNHRGESSAAMIKAWDNQEYAKENPKCPLVNIKAAFVRHAELVNLIQAGALECKFAAAPFCETRCTKTAAAMERLGHSIEGIAYRDGRYYFRFHQSAASDFALWNLPAGELEKKLPDALISYLWCAFDNHRVMVDYIKKHGAQYAAVQHRDRTAYVGRDDSPEQINQLEKLLYRR